MTRSTSTRSKLARVVAIGTCTVSLLLPLALARTAVAQDAESDTSAAEKAADKNAASDSDREPKPRQVESPVSDPLNVPTKDDWREQRQQRDEKTLFAPSPAPPHEQQLRQQQLAQQFEQLKRQQEALIQERTRLEQEFRRAMAELEQVRRQSQQEAEMAEMAKREAERARLAEMVARGRDPGASLPKNATTKVVALRNSTAADSARVLSDILGGKPMRIAVDERTNSLIVMADDETTKMVEALLLRLDESTREARRNQPGETLQLRIVWLLDGDLGMPPTDHVSPEVVEALHGLGFKDPEVVCQQISTFTLGSENREGQFDFQVPVLIKSQPWQLRGQGQVQPTGNERFNLRFDLRFSQVNPSDGRTRSGESGQLGGSIHTPLRHYTVMGTTTFVAPEAGDPHELGAPPLQPKQHLSAFVVFLDRAREFAAAGAETQSKK